MKVTYLEETTSTNQLLLDALRRGDSLEHGEIICASFQTDGRGQMNNHWESERGMNLLFSMVLFPMNLEAKAQFPLSEAVALAMCDVLSRKADGFSVKWPNDIYWHDKKISGILIENNLNGALVRESVVGIGLNINQETFHSDAPNPISLKNITGKDYNLTELLEEIQEAIMKRYIQSEEDKSSLHNDYKKHLYLFNTYHPFTDINGTYTGRIIDVEPTGHVIIEDTAGVKRKYAFKEVQCNIS